MIKKKKLIKTDRLELKPFRKEDEGLLIDLLTNEEISKTFMIPMYKTTEEYKALISKLYSFSQLDNTEHYEYGVYLKNKLIGFINDCGFKDNEIELGYVINPEYKNNGYATETLKAVLKDLLDMGFKKVTCGYFKENLASKKVMLKAGMKEIDKEDIKEYRGKTYTCKYCSIEN